MSIKQAMTFDQSTEKRTVFETSGAGDEGDEEPKEALVFMLVGVRDHWKAPIGYFLTKKYLQKKQEKRSTRSLSSQVTALTEPATYQ